jgi:hypothetical protein
MMLKAKGYYATNSITTECWGCAVKRDPLIWLMGSYAQWRKTVGHTGIIVCASCAKKHPRAIHSVAKPTFF